MSRERTPPGGAAAGEPRGDERSRDEAGRAERDRRRKLAEIAALGVPPWPSRFAATHTLEQVAARFGDLDGPGLDAIPEGDRQVRVAGRITARRSFGKASFIRLLEGPGSLQAHLRRDVLPERDFAVAKQLDLGDWVGVSGPVFRTRTGELTVRADALSFLAKALLPPPEKWHGLTDRDTRYRQRYLDLLGNPATREVFRRRAALVSALRRFMDGEGFLEVETPMLQPLATGAAARPFRTRHRALGTELYLRVAPELYLKRLVVGGFPRVYEINRNFRNEGLSTRHNPEFTMLEYYRAFGDCADMMDCTERLLVAAARETLAGRPAVFSGEEIRFEAPFRRVTLTAVTLAALRERGLSLEAADLRRAAPLADAHREFELAPPPEETAGHLLLSLFEALVERRLVQPTFVTGYPVEVSPLSKANPDDPAETERFELFAGGLEIANGFSELNDPDEQAARFGEQMARRPDPEKDPEDHAMDWDYIEALRHGLPPTGGVGVGVDRVAMLLTDSPAIRDVILFPHLRPRENR